MLLFYLSLIENEEDKSKFEMLYNKHRSLLKYIAVNILDDEFLAEDAVNEAFFKLTRYINGIEDVDSHKTKSFIVIVVKSVCKDMIRKANRDKSFGSEEIEEICSVNDDGFKNIEFEYIYKAIESLSDKYREIIELKVYHDFSDKQIAYILGIDNAAVRKRLQRARESLKKKLAERGEDYVSV